MTLIHGSDKEVAAWVSKQLFNDPDCFDDKARAIGVMSEGQLIAGIVYTNYQPEILIEMSIASIDRRWATRHNIRAFFEYPFIKLGLKRVQTLCSAQEGDVMLFNTRLGFKKEGYHPCAWHNGTDAVSFGMLKQNCRWI